MAFVYASAYDCRPTTQRKDGNEWDFSGVFPQPVRQLPTKEKKKSSDLRGDRERTSATCWSRPENANSNKAP